MVERRGETDCRKPGDGASGARSCQHVAVDICNLHGVDKDRILGMRWVLVWKPITDESGTLTGRKAKARLIIKGFQDPDLLHISRDSPTLSTLGRNLLLSLTSHFGWEL